MGKRKRKQRKAKRGAQRATPSTSPSAIGRLWQLVRFFCKVLLGLGALLGFVVALLSFFPNVEVRSPDMMKPARTINSPFIIKNSGLLSVRELRFEYFFRTVESKGPDWHNLVTNTITRTSDLPITSLRPHESTTAICVFPLALYKPITMADVEISLFYKYLFWKKNERFRFITLENKDGYLYWAPKSMAEK